MDQIKCLSAIPIEIKQGYAVNVDWNVATGGFQIPNPIFTYGQ